jgi:FxLD family lantipeptide
MDASEFELNVHLVDAGPAAAVASEDCTSDDCGSGGTSSDACTTNS